MPSAQTAQQPRQPRAEAFGLAVLAVTCLCGPADGSAAHASRDYILLAGEDDAGTPYVSRLRIRR